MYANAYISVYTFPAKQTATDTQYVHIHHHRLPYQPTTTYASTHAQTSLPQHTSEVVALGDKVGLALTMAPSGRDLVTDFLVAKEVSDGDHSLYQHQEWICFTC